MKNSTFCPRRKGRSRISVVHSNASPYAAAAAMGMAMGRSERAGPYFNLLRKPNCDIQAQAATVPVGDPVDFVRDWAEFLRKKGMVACGLTYDESQTSEENTMRYLNARRRIPITAPRTVHESRELSIPQEHQADYVALKTLITSGGDLKPYLSHDILKKKQPDKPDNLLNAEGIQHLHFRAGRPGYLLLCRITDFDVFVVQALPHVDSVWADASLLQILHDNWPEEIADGKCRGLKGDALQSRERSALRYQNANFATTMADETVYLTPGGGLTASGHCVDDRVNCDKMFRELVHWQNVVKNNSVRLRAALNWPESKELSIRMMFEGRDCWLYEPRPDAQSR